MKKKYFILIVIQFFLLGCTHNASVTTNHTETAKESNKDPALIMVSSGKAHLLLPAFTTYTWSPEYNRILFGNKKNNEIKLQKYIREEIISYLKQKGYLYEENPEQADVIIGFLFAIKDDVGNKKLQQRFGLLPSVIRNRVNTPRYQEGTFILAVLDNKGSKTYWRGGVKGLLNLEKEVKSKNNPLFPNVINLLLDDFPFAGK